MLSGTGIVEKNHRTIKRMADRSGRESPLDTDPTNPDSHILRQIYAAGFAIASRGGPAVTSDACRMAQLNPKS